MNSMTNRTKAGACAWAVPTLGCSRCCCSPFRRPRGDRHVFPHLLRESAQPKGTPAGTLRHRALDHDDSSCTSRRTRPRLSRAQPSAHARPTSARRTQAAASGLARIRGCGARREPQPRAGRRPAATRPPRDRRRRSARASTRRRRPVAARLRPLRRHRLLQARRATGIMCAFRWKASCPVCRLLPGAFAFFRADDLLVCRAGPLLHEHGQQDQARRELPKQ